MGRKHDALPRNKEIKKLRNKYRKDTRIKVIHKHKKSTKILKKNCTLWCRVLLEKLIFPQAFSPCIHFCIKKTNSHNKLTNFDSPFFPYKY